MRFYSYPVVITQVAPDDYHVRSPSIPEVFTAGDNEAEALANAVEAVEVAIEHYLNQGLPLPAPRPAEAGEVDVPLAPAVAARAALLEAMTEQRLSKVALAKRMGKDEKVARRVLSGKNASLELTLEALRALGLRPTLAA